MGLFNLEEQLTFYGQYHHNKINVIIHIGMAIAFSYNSLTLWTKTHKTLINIIILHHAYGPWLARQRFDSRHDTLMIACIPFYKVCVPLILWSAFVWASNTGPLVGDDEESLWSKTPFEPNLAFFAALFYVCYYLLLEPIAGVSRFLDLGMWERFSLRSVTRNEWLVWARINAENV